MFVPELQVTFPNIFLSGPTKGDGRWKKIILLLLLPFLLSLILLENCIS